MKIKNKDKIYSNSKDKLKAPSSRIPGFYRLSVEQRLAHLIHDYGLTDDEAKILRRGSAIKSENAVNMIENAIGSIGIPLGLAPNFLINDKDYLIPMAIEEPSVIAAASKAAGLIRRAGGFVADADQSIMIGQIQLVDFDNVDESADALNKGKREILDGINKIIPRMYNRGGGAREMELRIPDGASPDRAMIIVHLHIDVCDAMGANVINSVCEKISPLVEKISGGRANMRILSNLADKRLARASFKIPFELLSQSGLSGHDVALRLEQASHWAEIDQYRATTHNKGVFNGISAVTLALGLDWRAVESGGHAYAARNGTYRGLTKYKIDGDFLTGEIEMPIQVGWSEGTSCLRDDVRVLQKIIKIDSARELSAVLASVGLAQNLAACLALCTDGIQRGHMSLHARSVAASTGIPGVAVDEVANEMLKTGQIRVDLAEKIYKQRIHKLIDESSGSNLAEAFAPGKVMLFGEHAVVYGHPAIVTALNQGTRVSIRHDKDGPRILQPKLSKAAFPFNEDLDIQRFSMASNLALKGFGLAGEPIELLIESDLAPGVGLGSSAAFSVATCRALKKLSLKRNTNGNHSNLQKMIHRLETVFHRNPSGADAAAIMAEGAIWFKKSQPSTILPIKCGREIRGLVCVVDNPSRTANMVSLVSQKRSQDRKFVDDILNEIGDLTLDAALAFEIGDTFKLGALMNRNHELLAGLGLSTDKLDFAVDYFNKQGALGAKLTGGGGGGAVVMILPDSNDAEKIINRAIQEYKICYPFKIPIQ